MDVGLSAVGLVTVSPILAAVAVCLRAAQGSPVLFRQERTGRDEQTFVLVKFRTMKNPIPGVEQPDRERLSRLGIFMRKSSLDELPELWNVLRGDMSLVGPRPLPLKYTPYFNSAQRRRFSVRPGMTGLAQVAGRNSLSWTDRIAKDVEYAESVSLYNDLRILARTIVVALRSSGFQVDPGRHMLDFDVECRARGNRGLGNE